MIRFLVNIPAELHGILKETAGKQGQTLNGLIRQILWDWAKEEKIYITEAGKHYLDNKR